MIHDYTNIRVMKNDLKLFSNYLGGYINDIKNIIHYDEINGYDDRHLGEDPMTTIDIYKLEEAIDNISHLKELVSLLKKK